MLTSNPLASPVNDGASTSAIGSPFDLDRLSRVLDAQALEQLATLDPQGTKGLLMRVLTAYQASGPRLLYQLREAVKAGDWVAARSAAHTLKSSSASVGALTLSHHCAELESCIRDNRHSALGAVADALITEGDRLFAALKFTARS